MEAGLLRERGLFGPGPGVLLNRGWVQDEAEGPNRTRPRIRRRAQRRSKRVGLLKTSKMFLIGSYKTSPDWLFFGRRVEHILTAYYSHKALY